jgi:hypothetical protein
MLAASGERRSRSILRTNKGRLPLQIPQGGPCGPLFIPAAYRFAGLTLRFFAGARFTPAMFSSTAQTTAVSSFA